MENVQCFSPSGFLFQEQHCFISSGLKYKHHVLNFVHHNVTEHMIYSPQLPSLHSMMLSPLLS